MNKPVVGITMDTGGIENSGKIAYARSVDNAGGNPVFLQPVKDAAEIRDTASNIGALLIPGGRDIDPAFYNEEIKAPVRLISGERFFFEKALLKEVMRLRKPVLAICYGMQFLNVFEGGSLYQDLSMKKLQSVDHKSDHKIKIYNKTRLYYISGVEDITVNSAHHQGIKKIGRRLIVAARSRDNLVEAVELKNYPFLIGVQWHPERLSDGVSRQLFESLVNAVKTSVRPGG